MSMSSYDQDQDEEDRDMLLRLQRMTNLPARRAEFDKMPAQVMQRMVALDPSVIQLRDEAIGQSRASAILATSVGPRISPQLRDLQRDILQKQDLIKKRRADPTLTRRTITEEEKAVETLKRKSAGLSVELNFLNDSGDDDEGEREGGNKKFKRYYYEDVDEKRYIVYDRTEAVKWGKESLFVRRMTNILRLDKTMSGEGLKLDEGRFLEVLTGRMTEELLGIGREDPTFVSNLELKRILGLPVMRDVTKFGRLLRGEVHTLGDFILGGKITDLTQFEQACIGVQHVFAAVFDLRWAECMKTVLSVIRDPVMRQVTLNFILVRVEGAWRSFNRIMVGPDRYVKNPAEIKHPEELVRIESVIQLWLAQQSGLLEQCRDPVALIRWYSEFGGGIDSGPSTVDEVDKVWSGGLGGKLGGATPSTPDTGSKKEKSKDRSLKRKEIKKTKKELAKSTPPTSKVAKTTSTPSGGNSSSSEYCVESVKKVAGLTKEGCKRVNCRFQHPTTRKEINGEDLKTQTKGTRIAGLDELTRKRLLNQLGVKIGPGE
jgi:hypothetical protein